MAAQTTPISIAFATPRVSEMTGAQAIAVPCPACEQPDRRVQPLETGCTDAGEVLREHESHGDHERSEQLPTSHEITDVGVNADHREEIDEQDVPRHQFEADLYGGDEIHHAERNREEDPGCCTRGEPRGAH
jgi:hypothetical protein